MIDENVKLVFEQFASIANLATSTSRATAIDAMRIPFDDVKARLQALLLYGSDLFVCQFLHHLESEVKRIKTTQKLTFMTPPQRAPCRLWLRLLGLMAGIVDLLPFGQLHMEHFNFISSRSII